MSKLRLGTAPDSWGVWFPSDPRQLRWEQFLNEAAQSGYQWIELGPYGYLPTDPPRLRDELGSRGLALSGGAVVAGLHRGHEGLAEAVVACRKEAELLTALGASHLVLLPEQYTDLTGNLTQRAYLGAEQWRALLEGASALAKVLDEEFGVSLAFHPHADSHVETQAQVERFMEGTDPGRVLLCLDTGHISYRGGDNMAIIRKFAERIGYVHLKQINSKVIDRVAAENLCFADAVRLGAMVEPPGGEPAMEPLLEELAGLDADLFAIVEQDMYPCQADAPLPIATRTCAYYAACGLGPGPR
jgi:inosose dehydratase